MKKRKTFKIFYKIGLGYLLVLAVLAGCILLIQNSTSQPNGNWIFWSITI